MVEGKRGKYRLIPMNSKARTILFEAVKDRGLDELVFDKDANGVNEYMLRWGFEAACKRAGIPFGETTPGGIIWHDLRRTFATRLRAHGVHEYDIQDLLGHSKPGVTTVYARATHGALEAAVEKLIEPNGSSGRVRAKGRIEQSLICPSSAYRRHYIRDVVERGKSW